MDKGISVLKERQQNLRNVPFKVSLQKFVWKEGYEIKSSTVAFFKVLKENIRLDEAF